MDEYSNNLEFTENGAVSLKSTLDARLNLFFKTVRDLGSFTDDTSNQELYELINKSFKVSPLDTVKILMNWRDCRGGKGDHRGFLVAFAYLSKQHPKWFYSNLHLLSEFGSYLDYVKLWHLVEGKQAKGEIMDLIVDNLKQDMKALEENTTVSLLAKWLPSEKYKWDRYDNHRFVYELCRKFFRIRRVDNNHLKMLRKQVIVPLREHIKIVESKMCAQKYNEIDYEKVPSVAMNKYKKAFQKNDAERFNDYMSSVSKGEKKINSSQVYPHDLVRQYLNQSYNSKVDDVIEAQWKEIKKKVQETKAFDKSIVVCDVSGSMNGIPMEVAIALGLLGLYDNKLITFSEQPSLYHVPDGSLYEQVQLIKKMPWGYNTNFSRVMDLVIGLSARKPEDAIKRIFIFSDMQFDVAVGLPTNSNTHFETFSQRFKDAGVEMPQIVFWNLRGGTKDFPVKYDERGVVMMSGYSPALLTGLLDGKQVTPVDVMMNIINTPRYNMVKCPSVA